MSEKAKDQTVTFQLSYSQLMKRFYFNRFVFSHTSGLSCVRVWFQDELKRDGLQYAFVFSDEDFKVCKGNIKTYLQKILRDSSVKSSESSCVDQCPAQQPFFDSVRTMMCSRSGTRAEIYLGFLPLAMTVSGLSDSTKWEDLPIDIALCSDLECHVALLKKMVEA